jgi:cellulose synthase/poly-beta-1,6-N-acetylglucosamine synthase-like glycosyltransferase
MILLLQIFYLLSFVIVTVGACSLIYFPLALIFAWRSRHASAFRTDSPLVSIIIPAYNEGKVIQNCIESILRTGYPALELILVDDGSSDDTLATMKRYENPPQIRVVAKANGGKASALNAGMCIARGEILFFVDADGIFTHNTIREMLNGFTSEKVGAVCGNDEPVNLDRVLTQLLCLQTHSGTGFVRRGLALMNCLTIVSGNIGAFRRDVLQKIVDGDHDIPSHTITPATQPRKTGPFLDGSLGEDLELTWQVHRAGYRVNFAPTAIVLAEVPSTIKSLWKQRVRWARGYLQTVRLHQDMFFNPKYGLMGFYLPLNFTNMVIIPILQLVTAGLILLLGVTGYGPIALEVVGLILWLGIGMTLFTSVFSIALDRAWKDLRYIYVIPLLILYSLLLDMVMVWAIMLETSGKKAEWNKVDRTGIVSRKEI